MPRSSLLVGALALVLVACSSDGDGPGASPAGKGDDANATTAPPGSPADVARRLAEKPWEVVSTKGETYLPNVFYADASENEQIMPYALDGHVMIDRLIYPTIGNPNLYTKSDPSDELVVVLRIEDAAYAHLQPKLEPVDGSSLSRLVVPNDPETGFGFFLIPRKARDPNTEATTAISSGSKTDVVRIFPNEIFVNPEPPEMPAVLKQRHTLRFVFRQGAMEKAPAGLYDLRFEVKKDNALFRPTPASAPGYEYQYNAVRVFDTEPDEYSVLNVTDTQVSVGDSYSDKTTRKLDDFVQFVNTTNDPNVTNAQFITFNGDLHNGGTPTTFRQRTVAHTYNEEAKAIVSRLKFLSMPIFLTIGNHDGYVATGHAPSAVVTLDSALGTTMHDVVAEANPKAWPDFDMSAFDDYLKRSDADDALGGYHRDVFVGGFSRSPKLDGFAGWREIPREQRNYVLYDGFYQWQKTYGPLYYSHKFGKNFYVSLNSFELRQHRRAGWGMYTVNYGGGVSDVQVAWVDRELLRASQDGNDVVVLAHHDPRGGHTGQDLGYYFEQVDYKSVYQSAINYLASEVWNPEICKAPSWALPREQTLSCIHDGLQEWMRPDPEFDCDWDKRLPDLTCDAGAAPFSSGVELLKRLTGSEQVRTVVLGHTHYNALEVLQGSDEVLPVTLPTDANAAQRFATFEIVNPIRGYSVQSTARSAELAAARSAASPFLVPAPRALDYDHQSLSMLPLEQSFARFVQDYRRSLGSWQRTLSNTNGPRELVVMRLVSNADLTDQTLASGTDALGFSALHFTKKDDTRGVTLPQINAATFFRNTGGAVFEQAGTIDIDRTKTLHPHDPENPVQKLYRW